jgi:hypothetical protein
VDPAVREEPHAAIARYDQLVTVAAGPQARTGSLSALTMSFRTVSSSTL